MNDSPTSTQIHFTIETEASEQPARLTATGASVGTILESLAKLNDPVEFAGFTAAMSGHLDITHEQLFVNGISGAVQAALDRPLPFDSSLPVALSDGVTLSLGAPTVRLAIEATARAAMPEHLLEISGQITTINA